MNKIMIAALCVALTGCGTITRGSDEDVAINVTPDFASVTTDIGKTCTGSCTLNVPRKQSFTVTASAPGYKTEKVFVGTKVSGAGGASMVGNALVGGVVGVAIDSASGASLDHTPNPVIIDLEPVGTALETRKLPASDAPALTPEGGAANVPMM